jgi:CxxC motif-containing protein (DUF1111 family)
VRTRGFLQRSVLLLPLAAAVRVGLAADPAIAPGPEWLTPALGGEATLAIANENAYARPLPALPVEALRTFTFGNRLFNTNWVTAPASVDGFDGLGPVFNRVSCSGCHTRDGRGRPPDRADDAIESMLVRISVPGAGPHGEAKSVPGYGDQLNEKAVAGVPAEGRTHIGYETREGRYADGTPYTLAVPVYTFTDLAFGPLPKNLRYSPRVAAPVFGLGLLEAVPETTLLARADPDDADGDGISGRANHVWDIAAGRKVVGRFGWKANQPNLRQQDAGAALGDIGLTTSLFPRENVAAGQDAAARAPSGGDNGAPELSDAFFDKLIFYTQTLAVPAARHTDDPVVREGAQRFAQLQCTACHVPTLETGDYPSVPSLSHQTIHPFTDLLLHDMGDDLGDGRSDFEANGREWRTPPLWGIGLTATVNRHTHFLHDGRARSLEEAVLWHGGEAEAARTAFVHLDKPERDAVIAFLDSL